MIVKKDAGGFISLDNEFCRLGIYEDYSGIINGKFTHKFNASARARRSCIYRRKNHPDYIYSLISARSCESFP